MGYSGKLGTIAIAKQTAKGAAAAVPTVKFKLSAAPSVMPVKEIGRYVMTDIGRDPGPAYTSRLGVSGDFQVYLHFDGFALLAYLALGSNADSGAGPDYTHTATPANDLPYCTVWRMVGNVIFEKFVDCKVNSLRVESAAGSPATATVSIEGIAANADVWQAADTVAASLESNGLLHMEAFGKFLLGGAAARLSRYSFEVTNGASAYQTDNYTSDEIDVSGREVTVSFALRFTGPTAKPSYRAFFYGSDAGLALSPILSTDTLNVEYVRAANKSVKIDTPQITYAAIPVNADPGGDPIEVEVSTTVEKPAGATPIVTITTKDQTATV